ncbi:MAG TPA: hypothetical protein VLM42_00155 [Bryobacteraceae bacterium]|nr:hypothetical protein [Bryobacteraceae bacterium]
MRLKFGPASALLLLTIPLAAQTAARIPRMPDGKPNLNGIWQTMNTANWDLLTHGPAMSPVVAMGAQGAAPPGIGVVEGNEIPYLPAAAKIKQENYAKRLALDPETKCYLPGVPRATYMPYPFQILQSTQSLMIAYEYAGAARNINMGKPKEPPTDSWMGWSNGHWDGDTLVVDVIGLNDSTWFDRAGDFHSDSLHVVERYTPVSADTIQYQATIDDPKTFSRPWKISMPLYRHLEKNLQLMEFKCVEMTEELLYGHLRKQPRKQD